MWQRLLRSEQERKASVEAYPKLLNQGPGNVSPGLISVGEFSPTSPAGARFLSASAQGRPSNSLREWPLLCFRRQFRPMRRHRAHRSFREILTLDPESVIEPGAVVLPCDGRSQFDQLGL